MKKEEKKLLEEDFKNQIANLDVKKDIADINHKEKEEEIKWLSQS